MAVLIRTFRNGDSIEELARLLHRAYASFTQIGIRMKAATQSAEETGSRIRRGECLVAEADGHVVGTVLWRLPGRPQSAVPYYRRRGVATFEQFAVEPDQQGRGIGLKLLREAEMRARLAGAAEIACDTAAAAKPLVSWYLNCGYRIVSSIQWPGTDHENLVLSKELSRDDLKDR